MPKITIKNDSRKGAVTVALPDEAGNIAHTTLKPGRSVSHDLPSHRVIHVKNVEGDESEENDSE